MSRPSYHDVVVYVGVDRYAITDNYALHLTCTRAAGWRLWAIWEGTETLLGGEYDGPGFRIEVAGHVICRSTDAPAPQETME